MKFFLTVYICSSLAGNCFTHNGYPKPIDNYYDCVQSGLLDSYNILYEGQFTEQDIVKYKMYPRFQCEEVILPPKKPDIKKKPAVFSDTKVSYISLP
jgi:hypothetical protein